MRARKIFSHHRDSVVAAEGNGVTHEKFVSALTTESGWPVRSASFPDALTGVLKVSNDQIGQSLIRALRHIIEFDSGLLIRHLDLGLMSGLCPAKMTRDLENYCFVLGQIA